MSSQARGHEDPAKAESQQNVLDGISVIELAEGVTGPFCGRMLAAFGAEVIKIERPPGGDWARHTEPLLPDVPEPESSALFLYLNSGKKSVELDWSTAEECAILKGLLKEADVVVENTRPDTLESLGLGYDELHNLNPGLIVASVSDFGDTGPYSSWISTPLVNLALGGHLYLSGDENGEPLMLPGFQADYLAGLHVYLGVTMALWSRSDTGEGQQVQVATLESLGALHQFTTVMETYSGLIRRRHGNRFDGSGYGTYPLTMLPCKDGYVAFAAATNSQWEQLCVMIGRSDLLDRPEFEMGLDRRSHADEIDEILIHWLKDKTKLEVFSEAAGTFSVPVAPMYDLSEVMSDPQYRERGLWATHDHPVAGEITHPTVPFAMSETRPSFGGAPTLGEQNAEILSPLINRFDSDNPG
ncbi:CoA transferase [Dehalococcoidia bacterium]|nr:CoA transferase [Dehalococcoidia bacterium]